MTAPAEPKPGDRVRIKNVTDSYRGLNGVEGVIADRRARDANGLEWAVDLDVAGIGDPTMFTTDEIEVLNG